MTDTERRPDPATANASAEIDEKDLEQAVGGMEELVVTKHTDQPSTNLNRG